LKYARGHITQENFLKGLDYTVSDNIGMHLHGEPFLHPKACELITIAKEKTERRINVNTNGTLLREPLCKDIIETKVDCVEVSVHTEKSLVGFKNLFEANKVANGSTKVTANVLTCYIDSLESWVRNVGINVECWEFMRIVPTHNWGMDKPSPENEIRAKNACQFIKFDTCVMKWDGKIYSCCFDFDGDNYMGTIDDLLAGTLEHKPDTYKLCASCSASWVTDSPGMNEGWLVPKHWLQ
jgi:MoaA/NifB/PqqE/SkfB family radical SAM enzyme